MSADRYLQFLLHQINGFMKKTTLTRTSKNLIPKNSSTFHSTETVREYLGNMFNGKLIPGITADMIRNALRECCKKMIKCSEREGVEILVVMQRVSGRLLVFGQTVSSGMLVCYHHHFFHNMILHLLISTYI